MLCTLFFAVALATSPEDGFATGHLDARQAAWAQLGPDALMQQALTLQSEGRRAAALERLAYLNEHHPAPVVTFQIGKTLELDEDYAGALAAYDDILGSEAGPDILHNAAFRRAIVLEDIGQHQASLAQIRALTDAGEWSEDESLSLALCRGIAELSSGRSRRGIRRIEASLAALEDGRRETWMRARARSALSVYLLEEAAALELKGNKKAARRLSQRNDLMLAAEQQVIAIANLGETEYILDGLQHLGDAYLQLHDDLLAAPAPRQLDDVQQAIYAETVASRASILSRKARMYYGKGLELADQVGWEGSARERLAQRLSRLPANSRSVR